MIVWDGGNNDFPFYRPDLLITVTDPLRAGHELLYHPGETNLRMADVVVVNKIDSARREDVERVLKDIAAVNPRATVVRAESPVTLEDGPPVAGAAGARRRGRADDHARRDAVRRGHRGGTAGGRGRRSSTRGPTRSGRSPRRSTRYPHIGAVLPGDGLRRRAAA